MTQRAPLHGLRITVSGNHRVASQFEIRVCDAEKILLAGFVAGSAAMVEAERTTN